MKSSTQLLTRFLHLALLGLLACQSPTDAVKPGGTEVDVPGTATGTPTEMGQPFGALTSKTIGPAGGTVATPDGTLTLTFPAGAVSKETQITVQPIDNKSFGGAGLGYRFGPDGSQFAKPVTMTWHYQTDDLIGSGPEALGIAFQDKQGVWQGSAKVQVNKTNQTVSAQLPHFSDWAFYEQFFLTNKPYSNNSPIVLAPAEHTTLTVYYQKGLKDQYTSEEIDLVAPLTMPEILAVKAERVVRWTLNGATAAGADASVGQLIEDNIYAQGVYSAPFSEPEQNPVIVAAEIDLKQKGHLVMLRPITIESNSFFKVGTYSDSNPTVLLTYDTKNNMLVGSMTDKTGYKNLTFLIPNFHGKGTYEVDEKSTLITARVDDLSPYGPGYRSLKDAKWISGGGKITITEYNGKSAPLVGKLSGTFYRYNMAYELESISASAKFKGTPISTGF